MYAHHNKILDILDEVKMIFLMDVRLFGMGRLGMLRLLLFSDIVPFNCQVVSFSPDTTRKSTNKSNGSFDRSPLLIH